MNINRRARQSSSPADVIFLREPEHRMEIGISVLASKILLLGHYEIHRTRIWERQIFILVSGLVYAEHLCFGNSRKCQGRCLERGSQVYPCSWGIQAEGWTLIGIKELRAVKRRHPKSFYNTDKPILPPHSFFVTLSPQNQNLGFGGNG